MDKMRVVVKGKTWQGDGIGENCGDGVFGKVRAK